MSEEVRVVGVCGSLRPGSHTRTALRRCLDASESEGAETELLDPRDYDLRPYDPSAAALDEMTGVVGGADSIVLATPMYHGSYSSPLKSVVDHCGFDEFEDKTVGLLAVSGGSFPVTALEHLRSVCRALNAWVVPDQAAVPRSDSAFEDGEFVDPGLEERVAELGRQVVRFAGVGHCDSFESQQNVGGR